MLQNAAAIPVVCDGAGAVAAFFHPLWIRPAHHTHRRPVPGNTCITPPHPLTPAVARLPRPRRSAYRATESFITLNSYLLFQKPKRHATARCVVKGCLTAIHPSSAEEGEDEHVGGSHYTRDMVLDTRQPTFQLVDISDPDLTVRRRISSQLPMTSRRS